MALLFVFTLSPDTAQGQSAPDTFAQEFMGQFDGAARKFEALAEAMPADAYAWSPGKGLMSVELVFMHIARYNYLYLAENLGMDVPEGINIRTMEEMTGKENVVSALKASNDYVRSKVKMMSAYDLNERTRLYGRDVQSWAVLFQLVSHMKEHLGQSIAYARVNEVKPPWAR